VLGTDGSLLRRLTLDPAATISACLDQGVYYVLRHLSPRGYRPPRVGRR